MKREITPLPTTRSLVKLFFLGLITLGIYPLVIYTRMSREINIIASPYDKKKTMHYCLLVFVFAPLTLTVGAFVWCHRFCNRIGVELARRGLPYRFSAATFWGRNIFSLLLLLAATLGVVYALYMHLPLPRLDLYWGVGISALTLLAAIGPCVFLHKLCTAMNMLSGDYNSRG